MSESFVQFEGPRFAVVSEAASAFDGFPRLRDEALCFELGRGLDALLAAVGRGRAALEIGIGERLDQLAEGDRALRLGYSGIGDHAREQLGLPASTARKLARFARRLRERPLLREAVRRGEVSVRQAEAVLPVALGEEEEPWVERARRGTVRALKAAVREACGGAALAIDEDEELFVRICIDVAPGQRGVVDEALDLAGRLIGGRAPKWDRLQALCEEYRGSHGGGAHEGEGEAGDGVAGASEAGDVRRDAAAAAAAQDDWMEAAREWLEGESAQWAFLLQLAPVPAPGCDSDAHPDPRVLHEELLRLAGLRRRWDEVFGHVAMLFLRLGAWRQLGFESFDHYAEERLGMSGRTVEQRAALERRLLELPALRRALAARRLSYEKARLIARFADDRSVEDWIERAARLTCIALRDELQGEEERQMCARGTFAVVAPLPVRTLLRQTLDAVRAKAGEWLPAGECLVRIARHFVDVWKPALQRQRTRHCRVLERDGGRCQVPGCSRAAVHAHHIEFRSAGGSDEPENLVGLCAAHHLRGVHLGRVRVRGTAPHALYWELGVCPPWPPVATA